MKKENIKRKEEIVDKAIIFMKEAPFRKGLKIKVVARECGVGYGSLAIMFQRVLNKTYGSLLFAIRVEYIYNIFKKNPKIKVKKIAEQIGIKPSIIYHCIYMTTGTTTSRIKGMVERNKKIMSEKRKVRKLILQKRIAIVEDILEQNQELLYRKEIEFKSHQRQIKTNPFVLEECTEKIDKYNKTIEICCEELDKLEEEEALLNESNNRN